VVLDPAADLLPLTVPELRRFLWRPAWVRPLDSEAVLAWRAGVEGTGGAGAVAHDVEIAVASSSAGWSPRRGRRGRRA
jgi:hypothetical protein